MAKFFITVPSVALFADKKDLNKVLRQAGKEIATTAANLIRNSQGGPGNPPKNRTGSLANNLAFKLKGNSLTVTDSDPASLALENGGKASTKRQGKNKNGVDVSGWHLEPHPFLSVALDNIEGDLGERIGKAIKDGISLKETK